jgi:transposase
MKAYSLDLRQKSLMRITIKDSLRQLASRFQVSLNFVQKLIRRYHNEGTLEPLPHGGGSVPNSQSLKRSPATS